MTKALTIFAFLFSFCAVADSTLTGIPLDTAWKKEVYAFAQKNVKHPSWGLAHSERNYQNSLLLAEKEKVTMDLDALFAAAFLHDLGGIGEFQKQGVDHAVRSVELAEPLLKSWGFPMVKWQLVKDMILGHTYYTSPPSVREAIIFRDADVLDFIGPMGVTRILAATPEVSPDYTLGPVFKLLDKFIVDMPKKLLTPTAVDFSHERLHEMQHMVDSVKHYSFDGKAF